MPRSRSRHDDSSDPRRPAPATCRSGTATRRSLALGGSRPLPELFEAADIRFDLSERTLRPVMEAVAREVDVPTA